MISKEIEVYQVIGDLDEECISHKIEMRHYKPTDSTELLIDGTLKQYMLDIDENANNKVNLLIKQLAESENINEQLKEHHQIDWVQAMNNIKNRAEEIVLNEIIYV